MNRVLSTAEMVERRLRSARALAEKERREKEWIVRLLEERIRSGQEASTTGRQRKAKRTKRRRAKTKTRVRK